MTRHPRLRIAALVAAFATVWAEPAHAHAITTGMGPFYDGIAHLLLTPEDAVIVVAVALYAGLRGPAAGRAALFLLPLGWFAGGLLGEVINHPLVVPVPAFSFLVAGVLVAADVRLPLKGVVALAVAVGLLHGYANGVAFHGPGGTFGLVGVAALSFVVVALLAALVVSLTVPWTRIAVRVAGSWIAASGLLLVGWALR